MHLGKKPSPCTNAVTVQATAVELEVTLTFPDITCPGVSGCACTAITGARLRVRVRDSVRTVLCACACLRFGLLSGTLIDFLIKFISRALGVAGSRGMRRLRLAIVQTALTHAIKELATRTHNAVLYNWLWL